MKQRVLILSTSAGSGHKTAAAALEQVFRRMPQVEQVINEDALERTNEAYRAFYADLYLRLVRDAPQFVGWWYATSDAPWKTDNMRLLLDRVNAEPLARFIRDFDPDICVCTHFMPAGIIAQLMASDMLDTRLAIVTTDLDFHSMWLSPRFSRYFVALDETKAHLVALGLPEDRVTVSGIPVSPAFAEPIDRDAVLARYRLRPDLPIVLASAGAAGAGPVREVVRQLLRLRSAAQVVVVCGRNDALRDELAGLVAGSAERFRILGFVDDMPALMRVATLLISKPGGLSAAEAMAAELPMALIAPIPGQEERNSDHLLEKGAAIRLNEMLTVAYKIDRLLDDPARLEQMRESARRIGRPSAAQTIAEVLLAEEDTPVAIDARMQRRMAAASAAAGGVQRPPLSDAERFAIFEQAGGALVGQISGRDMRLLTDNLVSEGSRDDDFYVNRATIEMLRERGASAELCELLGRVLGDGEEGELRWERVELPGE